MTADPPEEVSLVLDRVLSREAHRRWWITPIPRVGGRSPREMWGTDPDAVRKLVNDYLDPGFS